MTFLWAARQMKRGKEVRMASEPLEVFHSSEHFDGAIYMSRNEGISNFARVTVAQVLAQDWELVND